MSSFANFVRPMGWEPPVYENPGDLNPLGWDYSQARPAGPLTAPGAPVDAETVRANAVHQATLDAERAAVRELLGLDEPLDHRLTATEQVEAQRLRLELGREGMTADAFGPAESVPQPVEVAAGHAALAGV